MSNLPDKEFKATVIKMLNKLQRQMEEHSDNFSKELQNIKKNQSELKNTITEMKNALEGINSRLGDTEECITQNSGNHPIRREKRIQTNKDSLRDL